ncbi:hypothetical protein, partial [Xanthobacter autotrophicus]|uniref:hypothetical protein n=1 Tax=Xanthobacter autotrophicus TaxID=280 RepID=UPI003726B8A3
MSGWSINDPHQAFSGSADYIDHPVGQLYSSPTVGRMARRLEAGKPAPWPEMDLLEKRFMDTTARLRPVLRAAA